jgi:hypothetical protein
MDRIPKEQNDDGLVRALSCKSCSSCPKHLFWLRLCRSGKSVVHSFGAAGRAGRLEPFLGKSSQVAIHELFTSKVELPGSSSIKPVQAYSSYFSEPQIAQD